jgi:hypothetical protein
LWIFVTEKHLPVLEQDLKATGMSFEAHNYYKTLGQIEVIAKSAMRGETRDRWNEAFRTRSLEPVKETIFLYRVNCEGRAQRLERDGVS